MLDWYDIERLFDAQGLPPAISPSIDRSPVARVRRAAIARSASSTSHGWSPILKQAIGLASVSPALRAVGSKLDVEWTVEGQRGRVDATVVRAAVPRPRAQARVTAEAGASVDFAAITGQEASIGLSMAGTVPMFQVCAQHRVPATTLGAGRDDCRAHAPDENVWIEDLATATRITGRFLDRFAALPEVPRVP